VLFLLTKTEQEKEEKESTIDRLAKVIALWFQDAVGQNFGWWTEKAKKKRKILNK